MLVKGNCSVIYTIGYEYLSPADLAAIAAKLDAVVIDVRSRPSGRVKRGFSRADLTALLTTRYAWWGDDLGGQGVTAKGLDALELAESRHASTGVNLLLLCQESAPGDCHRHHAIAMPLAARGVTVVHIYEDEAFTATALQRAIDDADPDAAYDCVSFAELLAGETPPA